MAFFGYPRGIGLTRRLGADFSARTPNECMDTLPRTRASPEPMGHDRGVKPGRPLSSCNVKLLAASVVQRRNVPPFSKVSKQWRRFFGLRSDAPSRASFPSPANLDRVAQRSYSTTGSDHATLEDLFHLVVVILNKTPNLLRLLRTLQLPAHKAILRTVV